jgi:hypothetical protein
MHYKALLPGTLEVLKLLMKLPRLQAYNLAGGTSLALQIGHRRSLDLDLFGEAEMDFNGLVSELSKVGAVEESSRSDVALQLVLNGIKVDIVRYQYALLENLQIEDGLRLLSLADIAAMKIAAVSNRGIKRDFYDIYFLQRTFSLVHMLKLFKRKYPHSNVLHAIRSLCYFEDAEREVAPLTFEEVSWGEIKTRLGNEVRILDIKALAE